MLKLEEILAKAKKTDLVWIRHRLMKHYGWMPIEQFKQIKIPELWGLIESMNKQDEQDAKMFKRGAKLPKKGKR